MNSGLVEGEYRESEIVEWSTYEESISPGVDTLFNLIVFLGADCTGRCIETNIPWVGYRVGITSGDSTVNDRAPDRNCFRKCVGDAFS